ncbi:FMN-binding protein [Lutimonas sp.]|uniref:FMN-binding protein n=1 Tax=Lutimonas sp. TaxID=1872403 RepID=UPI003D9ADBB7
MKLFLYISLFFILHSTAEIPKNYLKKIDKEVFTVFDIKAYEKVPVQIDPEILGQMSNDFDPDGFYQIQIDENHLGYFYFGKAPSKADEFDYVVIFDEALIIKKIKILAYREDYGGEISSKRWLRQFDGSDRTTSLKYGHDIIGISGATISAVSMCKEVNDLLKDLSKLPL